MKSFLFKILLLASLFSEFSVKAQFKPDSTKKVNFLIIPLLFRSPETKWATGITGSMSFNTSHKHDPLTRTSTIQAVFMFTQRHQNVQALDATIYFPKEKYIFYLQLAHSYFPDKYWGMGNNSEDINREDYAFHQIYFFPHLKKKIAKNMFVGVLYEYQKVFNIVYKQNGLYDSTVYFGKTDYTVSGLGTSLCYDTRNSSYWPTKGILVQGSFTYFNSYLGSTYNDLKTIVDIRYFKKLFKNTVFAGQVYNYTNDGQAPIRELAMLGGSNNLRGLYQGRYRDDNMTTIIGEYRIPVYKRFSTCIFGGIGEVYKRFIDVSVRTFKHSYGAGLRIAILPKEKLNIRIDYGFSDRHNKGLYFTVGECF
jgi:outer membrane protein assembly factor BamA